jgi:hypothetical protein
MLTGAGCRTQAHPLVIVLEGPGAFTVDGQSASTETLREVVRDTVLDEGGNRRQAFRQEARKGVKPVEVRFRVANHDEALYEDFAQAILAASSVYLERGELEGAPFRIPHSGSPRAGRPIRVAESVRQSFLPLECRKPQDLAALTPHASELRGCWVLVDADMEMPMRLVTQVAQMLHKAGARVVFCIPYDGGGDPGPRVIIKRACRIAPGASEDDAFDDILAPFPAAAHRSFFGIPLGNPPRKVVFVLDRSGSMCCSNGFVKFELERCIGDMAESDGFHIIFFSSGPPVEMPPRRLVNATDHNKQLAFEFIDGVIARGETDPSQALERAFAAKPDIIYLLTDDGFDPHVARLVKDLNKDGKVKVHTIGFLYKTSEAILKQIAAENGGTYKFVTEADLENLAKVSS